MDWSGAGGIATTIGAVATAIFTGATFALTVRYLRKPLIRVEITTVMWQQQFDRTAHVKYRILNAGTAPVTDLRVYASVPKEPDKLIVTKASVQAGDELLVNLPYRTANASPTMDPDTLVYRGDAPILDVPKELSVLITWHQPPALEKMRTGRWVVHELLDRHAARTQTAG